MFYMIAGIVIMTASLLLHQFKRRRLELEQQAKRRAAVEAIRETERKQQFQTVTTVKAKPEKSSSAAPERISLPDFPDQQFTGMYSPRNIAKWEAEIHQIGRQMIGTLDSKMVALQTLTQEANRTANRMELLLERFEELAQSQFNPTNQLNPIKQSNPINQSNQINQKSSKDQESQQFPVHEEKIPAKLPEPLPNLIPAGIAELPATSLVLNDFQPDQLQQPNLNETPETIPHATILKVEDIKEKNKPEKKSPFYEKPTFSPEITSNNNNNNNNSLRQGMTGTGSRIKPLQRPENLSFGSLYDDKLAEREHGEVFAVAAASRSGLPSIPDSRLDLQKQIEMLDNYGYSSRQIAQSLNITVGEVDLLLKLKGEK
jgi:hypothetical protein